MIFRRLEFALLLKIFMSPPWAAKGEREFALIRKKSVLALKTKYWTVSGSEILSFFILYLISPIIKGLIRTLGLK